MDDTSYVDTYHCHYCHGPAVVTGAPLFDPTVKVRHETGCPLDVFMTLRHGVARKGFTWTM
jgi:hypothetical protein